MSDNDVLEFPARAGGCDPDLVAAVEALLFASGAPITVRTLAELLEVEPSLVQIALRVLVQRTREGGVMLERVANAWQLRTAPRFGALVHRLRGTRPQRLSSAALEVLAAVAFKQPVTRPDIDALRGVDSGGVLKGLLDKGLVRTAGRAEDPGRPLLYRTTGAFLAMFGLPDLAALPTLAERASLLRSMAPEE